VTTGKFKFTFPIVSVGAVFATLLTITLVLHITIPGPVSRCQTATGTCVLTCPLGCESGRGHVVHSLDHGGHPYVENSRHGHVEGMENDRHDEERYGVQLGHAHARGQYRNARRQMEEYGPTSIRVKKCKD